jgi:hypothetical protein
MTLTMTALGDCPSCETGGFTQVSDLAAHLIEQHELGGGAALARARLLFTRPQEAPMAQKADRTGECSECHRLRHVPGCSRHFKARAEKASMPAPKNTTGRCGYCKRLPPDHHANCKRAQGATAAPSKGTTARRPSARTPGKPAANAGTNGLVSEIAALGAVAEALTPLDRGQQSNILGCICKLLAIDPSKLAA